MFVKENISQLKYFRFVSSVFMAVMGIEQKAAPEAIKMMIKKT